MPRARRAARTGSPSVPTTTTRAAAGSGTARGAKRPLEAVEIEGEAHRRHRRAEAGEELVVAPAGADRLARSGGIDVEDRARVVGEAADLTEVDAEVRRGEPALERGVVELDEPSQRRGRGGGREHLLAFGEGVPSAVQPDERAQRGGEREPRRIDPRAELVLVFHREGAGHVERDVRVDPLEKRAADPGGPEVDRERLEPCGHEPALGEREELEIAIGPRDPRELDPRLRNLPVLASATASPPEDRPFVAKAERRRPVVEARRDHASDLGRDVRTKRGHLPRFGLDEAEDLGGIEGAEPPLEHVGELERRGGDEGVPREGEPVEHAPGQSATAAGLLGEEVAHPAGERELEGTRRCRGHGEAEFHTDARFAPRR